MKTLIGAGIMILAAVVAKASTAARRMVIYDGRTTELAASSPFQSKDLWLTLKELTRATALVVKPQGVCQDELCFPLPKQRRSEFLVKRRSTTWFNLSEFARLMHQQVAYEESTPAWFFGPRQEAQNDYLSSLQAPNFTLPDISGAMHSLSDYRGKKVLLITWASW